MSGDRESLNEALTDAKRSLARAQEIVDNAPRKLFRDAIWHTIENAIVATSAAYKMLTGDDDG